MCLLFSAKLLLQRRMEVFVISDPKHPAKKHQANILQFLDVRTEERGVKAIEVCFLAAVKLMWPKCIL